MDTELLKVTITEDAPNSAKRVVMWNIYNFDKVYLACRWVISTTQWVCRLGDLMLVASIGLEHNSLELPTNQ